MKAARISCRTKPFFCLLFEGGKIHEIRVKLSENLKFEKGIRKSNTAKFEYKLVYLYISQQFLLLFRFQRDNTKCWCVLSQIHRIICYWHFNMQMKGEKKTEDNRGKNFIPSFSRKESIKRYSLFTLFCSYLYIFSPFSLQSTFS